MNYPEKELYPVCNFASDLGAFRSSKRNLPPSVNHVVEQKFPLFFSCIMFLVAQVGHHIRGGIIHASVHHVLEYHDERLLVERVDATDTVFSAF